MIDPNDIPFAAPTVDLPPDYDHFEHIANVNGKPARTRDEWLIDAADLLAEPDPGPTPWLVDTLIVAQAIVAIVGRWKTTKSYGLLDLCISIATGRAAFGHLTVPSAGPVIFINEESGRAAIWRRLDSLCRGRAIDPEELRGRLHVAANARIKLDDLGWQKDLKDMGADLAPVLICFDPLARMKAPGLEENKQSGIAYPIEFMRELRTHSGAAVAFVHHTGHQGDQMRGSSDLESVWESRLAWKRDGQSPEVTIEAEHREAEAADPIRYQIKWDSLTRTMRFELILDGTLERVIAHLRDHPDDSANKVYETIGGRRQDVLEAVRQIREQDSADLSQTSGSQAGYHPGTTPPIDTPVGGTRPTLFRGAGTTGVPDGSAVPVPDPETQRLLDLYATVPDHARDDPPLELAHALRRGTTDDSKNEPPDFQAGDGFDDPPDDPDADIPL